MARRVPSHLARSRSRAGHRGGPPRARRSPRSRGRPMTERLGRADLHIHTLASDGTASVIDILEHAERSTELDVIAITDHERIDAALAGRAIARDRGLSV